MTGEHHDESTYIKALQRRGSPLLKFIVEPT